MSKTTARIAASIVAALPLFAQNQGTPEKGVNFYNSQREAALGKRLADDVLKRTTPIENPTVVAYVDRLGQKLAAHMPESPVRFTFSLIAEDLCPAMHEPSALPGGYLFVPAALFLAARDEAEFAGMLAHAMAHIAARQGNPPSTGGQQTNLASVPLIFVGGWSGSCTVAGAVLVRYTEREQPAPSDDGSVELSSIPPRDQRVAAMTSIIDSMTATNYPALADGEFGVAREEVRRFVLLKNSPPPSLRRKVP